MTYYYLVPAESCAKYYLIALYYSVRTCILWKAGLPISCNRNLKDHNVLIKLFICKHAHPPPFCCCFIMNILIQMLFLIVQWVPILKELINLILKDYIFKFKRFYVPSTKMNVQWWQKIMTTPFPSFSCNLFSEYIYFFSFKLVVP